MGSLYEAYKIVKNIRIYSKVTTPATLNTLYKISLQKFLKKNLSYCLDRKIFNIYLDSLIATCYS